MQEPPPPSGAVSGDPCDAQGPRGHVVPCPPLLGGRREAPRVLRSLEDEDRECHLEPLLSKRANGSLIDSYFNIIL